MKRRVYAAMTFVLGLLLAVSAFAQNPGGQQTASVAITKNGFEPGNLKLKLNVPAKITFVRQTNDTCATSVVLSEYKIKKDLPLNQPVVVEFTPAKSGNFSFVCGMSMLKGVLIVEQELER